MIAVPSHKLIQISDCHLLPDAGATLKGVNPLKTLQQVCRAIARRHAQAEALLLTGDLCQHGDAASYALIRQTLAMLPQPAYALAGNHDDRKALGQAAGDSLRCERQFQLGRWQVLMLNSVVAGEVGGHIDDSELAWLGVQLDNPAAGHQLLALHHQPLDFGLAWADAIGIDNRAALMTCLQRGRRLRALVHGHTHLAAHHRHCDIDCYACPSSWRQFAPQPGRHRLDFLPPAYRVLQLFADGRVASWIEFASE